MPHAILSPVIEQVSRLSRTVASGRVDVSSSEYKAARLDPTLSRDARERRINALDTALFALDSLESSVLTPDLLMSINRVLSIDFVSSGFRDFAVPKFRYLDPDLIAQDCTAFCMRVRRPRSKLGFYPACDLMFDVHWSVNLRGHYFSDACGRTATVLGAWLSWKWHGEVLPLPARERYLSVASASDPKLSWRVAMRLKPRQ